jgi:peroxiredoxin (alkyl hydroperoxide reductase subunit C)
LKILYIVYRIFWITPIPGIDLPATEDQAESLAPTLRLEEPIPAFRARTTQGEISSSDYLGKWLILFSHPADFTPVCTSEFVAMQQSLSEFSDLNCNILGLSVDSVYSHIAWISSIKKDFGVEITFPIIEDISMSIAMAFGMIHEESTGTATVRSVFFIDDKGILRALIHYPMNVGRSISEILRTVSALQAADESKMSAPEGWQAGDDLVIAPPTSVAQADIFSTAADSPGESWYYSKAPGSA